MRLSQPLQSIDSLTKHNKGIFNRYMQTNDPNSITPEEAKNLLIECDKSN